MPDYLVNIMFHEPDSFANWNRGIIEDYESNSPLFVTADSAVEAIAWGEQVGAAALRHFNPEETRAWQEFGYCCTVIDNPDRYAHCLDFLQRVRVGEMPNLDQLGSEAYGRWMEEHGQSLDAKEPQGWLQRLLTRTKKIRP